MLSIGPLDDNQTVAPYLIQPIIAHIQQGYFGEHGELVPAQPQLHQPSPHPTTPDNDNTRSTIMPATYSTTVLHPNVSGPLTYLKHGKLKGI
jgi:hypothetical protein